MDHALTAAPAPDAAALTAWQARPAPAALAAAGSVVLVAATSLSVALSPADDAPLSAGEVESPDYWLTGLLVGLALGSLAALWVSVPTGAVWGAAVLVAPSLGEEPGSGAFVTGLTGAFLLACLGVLATSTRHRKAAAARAWATAPVHVPVTDPSGRALAQRWRGPWTLAGVLLLVAALVAGWMFVHGLAADRQFRAGALTAEGVVTEVSDDGYDLVVDVEGLHLDVPAPSVTRDLRDTVAVRYDGSGRAQLVDDPADPSGWLIASGVGIVGGPLLLLREAGRRRRVHALLSHGGPAIRMRADWAADEVVLAPVASPGSPVLRTGALAGLTAIVDLGDDDEANYGHNRPPVQEVSDEELLAMARHGWGDQPRDQERHDGTASPPTWDALDVLVVGLHDDSAPVALRAPDGTWYITETAPRPARRRGGRRAVRGGRPGDARTPRAGSVTALGRRTGRWGPWAAVPVVAVLGRWLAPELELWSCLVGTCFVGALVHAWSWSAAPAMLTTARGLVERGPVIDATYPWARVAGVVADTTALVIRTDASATEEADAIMFAAPPDGEQLLPGVTDPLVARERILAARASGAASATADTTTVRRPSGPVVVAALCGAAFLVGTLVG